MVRSAQPRVQRTRLRRAPTEAVSSQKTFAGQVAGQTRRAADAIVGQGRRKEAHRRRKEEAEVVRANDFGLVKALVKPSQASWAAAQPEKRRTLKIRRVLGCGWDTVRRERSFPRLRSLRWGS